MPTTLNMQFAESSGKPITLDGKLVYIAFERVVSRGDVFELQFGPAGSSLPQGVTLGVLSADPQERRRKRTRYAGELELNGERSSAFVLWRDTAPAKVSVACTAVRPGAVLSVANVWRRPDGMQDQYSGNAGMLLAEEGDAIVLACSNGYGAIDFADLEVQLRFVTTGADRDVG